MKRNRYIMGILFTVMAFGLTGCSRSDSTSDTDKDNKAVSIVQESKDKEGSSQKESLKANEIAFAQTDYFYSENLKVEIISGKPCDIYYTTDGTDPSREQKKYKKPIKIHAEKSAKAMVIKAKGYYEDGTESETIVHTFFAGKDVASRYDTLIFSITTDPYNLYDYEYGIFVEGKLRDEWLKKNPNAEVKPSDPANFNMRGKQSEREVFLEILQPDGTEIAAQNAGIRTYGGWSRAREQKPVKLYARKEYDENNKKFNYEFFPQKTAGDGTVMDAFKQLVLRSCGNDNGFAFIRDELFQTLAGRAGYQDYEAVRPAAVYVNGSYRGFFWLHEVYGDEYYEYTYGDFKGDFQIIEGGELFKNVDADGENAEAVKEYTDLYDKYSKLDLTDDRNYEELSKLVDIENYLDYYALQVYIGNEDWPHNNYKCYRYYTTEGEQYREAPFDGKWRYLLHDLDFSTGIYDTGAEVDNIGNYVGANGEIKQICPLFGQLMKREDCKEIFITQTLDLMNGAFAPDYLNKVLADMDASRSNELSHTYDKGLLDNWVRPEQLSYRLEVLRTYAKQRAAHILTKYQSYFGMGKVYTLKAVPAQGGSIKVNSFLTDQSFTGSYYENYDTKLTAVLPKDKKLDYWLVNGEKVESEELLITSADIINDRVEVTCVAR